MPQAGRAVKGWCLLPAVLETAGQDEGASEAGFPWVSLPGCTLMYHVRVRTFSMQTSKPKQTKLTALVSKSIREISFWSQIWVTMTREEKLKLPQISCSKLVTVLMSFYRNRTKQIINQGMFQICWWEHPGDGDSEAGQSLSQAQRLSDDILALGLIEAQSLCGHFKRMHWIVRRSDSEVANDGLLRH